MVLLFEVKENTSPADLSNFGMHFSSGELLCRGCKCLFGDACKDFSICDIDLLFGSEDF